MLKSYTVPSPSTRRTTRHRRQTGCALSRNEAAGRNLPTEAGCAGGDAQVGFAESLCVAGGVVSNPLRPIGHLPQIQQGNVCMQTNFSLLDLGEAGWG